MAGSCDRNSRDVVAAILEAFEAEDATRMPIPETSPRPAVPAPSINTAAAAAALPPQSIGVKDARKYSIGGRYTFRNGKDSTVNGTVLSIEPMAAPNPKLPHARQVTRCRGFIHLAHYSMQGWVDSRHNLIGGRDLGASNPLSSARAG